MMNHPVVTTIILLSFVVARHDALIIPNNRKLWSCSGGRISIVRRNYQNNMEDNLARAMECVDSIGECSIEEMEELKDNIHSQQGIVLPENLLSSREDLIELELEQQILMEEDLALQLDMLNDLREETRETWMNDYYMESAALEIEEAIPDDEYSSLSLNQQESEYAVVRIMEMLPLFLLCVFLISFTLIH